MTPTPSGSAGWALAFHEELTRLLGDGRRVAVATVIRGRGSHPRAVGARMIVDEDGRCRFTIGGGALEAAASADCRAALASGVASVHRYDLSEHAEHGVGMTCGGSVEVFIEVFDPPDRLIIFGAGHVGRALAQAVGSCGFSVTVVDDRSDWLNADHFPPGVCLHRCGRDYVEDIPAVSASDCVAVLTRCHATDLNVLRELLEVSPRYLGVIGSRRKIARAFQALEEAGASADWLERIHGPIGLDIGAETPGEIGVAIAAQVVAVLRSSGESEA